ncbi:hypothetical protein EH164_03335 [Kosakonia sp. CCTCC M2018092]|uniref:hypothetical protein n=1 Tax=Kosakonia sp. CCTCC M2018092 TaxID=2492396 RepID=UPI000F6087E0|nr:hypothetical protein [Kosakonia sp. CCTCC M2018092]AZI86161.1 hypothetical protein EH164_03335 [Kosakonia sp. CCTCC M2018092]
MDEQLFRLVRSNKFIDYVEQIGVETDLITNIFNVEFDNEIFSLFINNSEGLLSPNICVEETLFKVLCRYLNDNAPDGFSFENDGRLDVKTIISHSNSLIQRPKIPTPVETLQGFKEPHYESGFVRIARFEKQLSLREYGKQPQTTVLFEGLLPDAIDINPLPSKLSSYHIWNGSFYNGIPFVQGICGRINSLEPSHVLWLNSELLELLRLRLDSYKNGLRAINEHGEVILEYRQWKDKLIGNGSYFVGTCCNIAKLEGSDLIMRADFYKKLELLIPNLTFKSYILN